MNIVTAAQMLSAEASANANGLSYDTMMENAGRTVAEAIEEQFGAQSQQILILVGPGNNGGDGLVAARYLSDLGALVKVYIWKRANLENDPNWSRLQAYHLPITFGADDADNKILTEWLEGCSIVVDALLGTGVSRPISGDLAQKLSLCAGIIFSRRTPQSHPLTDPKDPAPAEELGPAVVAVDLPSGLHTDSGALDPLTLPADITVTFAAAKRGQVLFPGAEYTGQLIIADIGIAPEHFEPNLPQLATPDFIANLLPERPAHGHKGSFGKALVVAGCLNYTGAPYLSATAAYRVGAGVVTLALPAEIQLMVAAKLTEATYIPLSTEPHQAVAQIVEQLAGYSALLIGPGLGQAPFATDLVSQLLPRLQAKPLALDADGLNILAQKPALWTALPPHSILTPHPGEMSRLCGQPIAQIEANRLEFIPQMARQWNQIVVYKGAYTIIAEPGGETVVLPFANPALATAGSGDVLAGCIVGLLAQGASPFEAAVAGAYLHGLSGELAREQYWTAGVIAGDLLPLLPLAIKELVVG